MRGIEHPDESALHEARRRRRAAARERAFVAEDVYGALDAALGECARIASTSARRAFVRRIAVERAACEDQDRRTRAGVRTEILRTLARLDAVTPSAELSRQAPNALREAVGFTRVMISRARGSQWFPDTIGVADGADPGAAEFARFARAENQIPLGAGLAETRMLRRREPVLVRDAGSDPRTYKPLVRVTRSPGYVAAPIIGDGRVIGFLHADRADQHSPVTVGDRESVSLFAGEFGVLFESAVLRERLRANRLEVNRLLADLRSGLDALGHGDPLLVSARTAPPASANAAAMPAPRRDALLSSREREILELIARGATNAAIARELTISAETVKTHVSSILRKLRVVSRAGAVARYLQLNATGDTPTPNHHDGSAR